MSAHFDVSTRWKIVETLETVSFVSVFKCPSHTCSMAEPVCLVQLENCNWNRNETHRERERTPHPAQRWRHQCWMSLILASSSWRKRSWQILWGNMAPPLARKSGPVSTWHWRFCRHPSCPCCASSMAGTSLSSWCDPLHSPKSSTGPNDQLELISYSLKWLIPSSLWLIFFFSLSLVI